MNDRVFLHANILVSAAWREDSGLLALWALADTALLTSAYAVAEAERNVHRSDQRTRLTELVNRLEIVDEPAGRPLPATVVLPKKDQPILLAALGDSAHVLLTGDREPFDAYYGREIDGVTILRPSVTEPWLTSLRGLASYTVPKVDVLVSGIFRSQPSALPSLNTVAISGTSRIANFQMTPAQFLAATGRPIRAVLGIQFTDLLLPGELYSERVSAVDLRVAKIPRVRRYRANIGVDLFNLFNSNTPTFYDQVFDPITNSARWLQPTAVLVPRVARLNVQVDF